MTKQPVKLRSLLFASLLALGIVPAILLMLSLLPGLLRAYDTAAAQYALSAAQTQAGELTQRLERRRETVRNIAMLPAPLEILRSVEGQGAGLFLNVQQAAERFSGVIRRWFNPAGDLRQLALLDAKGAEHLRLESLHDTVVAVPPGDALRQALGARFDQVLAQDSGEPVALILPDLATLRILTAIHALDGRHVGVLLMDFDLNDILRGYQTGLWIDGRGGYLHPTRQENAFEDFPALKQASTLTVARDRGGDRVAWVPLRLGPAPADLLWIGTPVDESELKRGLTLIVFGAGLVFAIVAGGLMIGVHLLTRMFERGKLQLVRGVNHIVAGQPGVRFDWPWPAELHDFGKELTQLGSLHSEAVRALRLTRFSVEHSGEAIFWITADGRILYVNDSACALLGYDRSDLLATAFLRIDPTHARSWDDHWRQLRQAGTLVFETELTRKDGTGQPVEISANHMVFEGEQYNFAFVRDIRDRKAAAARLQATVDELTRSNAELERFAYVAAHDLQEPVRSVVSFAQLLERRLGGKLDQADRENLEFLVSGAKRMHALVHDLLAYAQVQRSATLLTPVDAQSAVDIALAGLTKLTEESGATIRCHPLPRVLGDAGQVAQVFQNLLSNAVKFARPGIPPLVEVTAERRGGDILFSIVDNGIGIEPEYSGQLFTLFRRLHGPSYPGTGLGLAVCRTIVERLGGRIWFESVPGTGTTFRFTLKAAPTDPGTPP